MNGGVEQADSARAEEAHEVVGLEDYAVKFAVVEGEKCRIDWRKLGSPRNWVKLGVRIGGVRVVRTSRHVIIHPGVPSSFWKIKSILPFFLPLYTSSQKPLGRFTKSCDLCSRQD